VSFLVKEAAQAFLLPTVCSDIGRWGRSLPPIPAFLSISTASLIKMWLLLGLLPVVLSRHLYVHLVPHSHEDLGWLKTVDEYYYGANQSIYSAGVQYILDSVVRELAMDPAKRFTYVEAGFFYRWWREQTPAIQAAVKTLVAGRQLQFANGGWVMHDEAATTFEDQLDQMAFGHQFLLQTFGITPTIGWQIDPFGHSEANADLYAKMGFNGLFFARIDYQDKAKRLNESSCEMIWRPQTGTGAPGEIFTHVLYAHYSFPSGFCWDTRCTDDPVMDDPTLENYNAPLIAQGFAAWVQEMAQSYRTAHLFVCMGDDFTYQNAAMVYKNMDKLIALVNGNATFDMTLMYSTPEEYLEAVHSLNETWPVKKDDFFPYADWPYAYWTGYFTSRPTLKGMIRTFGSRLRASLDLLSMAFLHNIYPPGRFQALRDPLTAFQAPQSVAQHHDAVTGTEKQHVTFDYERMLSSGSLQADTTLFTLVNDQAAADIKAGPYSFLQCTLANETICPVTERWNSSGSGNLLLAVLNPTYHNVTTIVQIPIYTALVQVWTVDNQLAEYDVVRNYYTPGLSRNNYTVYLRVAAGAMQTVYFLIKSGKSAPLEFQACDRNCKLSNSVYSLSFIGNYLGSSLWEFERLTPSPTLTILNITLAYYIGSTGDSLSGQCSGAYIFRPDSILSPVPRKYADFEGLSIVQGTVVDLAILSYGLTAIQVLTVPKSTTDSSVQIDHWLNSISLSEYTGKEIVTLYTTSLYNNESFYTDSNGIGMVPRVWNYQPTWELNYTNEPQSCNYYPVTSCIFFVDQESGRRFSVVTDRSEGGTSTNYGAGSALELMVHRRLLMDDGRGVGEALDEPDPYDPAAGLRAIVRHKLLFGNSDLEQRIAEETFWHPTQLFISPSAQTQFSASAVSAPQWSALPVFFQANFRPYTALRYVLRLRNMLMTPQSLNLTDFLSPLSTQTSLEEAALTENQPMSEVLANHMQWQVEGEGAASEPGEALGRRTLQGPDVLLSFNAGQVRSFFVDVPQTEAGKKQAFS